MKAQDVTLPRYDILQLYMAVGGIPMYLSYVQPGKSLAQIIDDLYFVRKAKLKNEFDRLFNSIFRHSEQYKNAVTLAMIFQKNSVSVQATVFLTF